MTFTLWRRADRQDGFTLIELLVALIIIGVLIAVAVSAYLAFRDRAEKRAAQANVRAAVPSVEMFYSDEAQDVDPGVAFGDRSYTGLSLAALQARDASLNLVTAAASGPTSYCISSRAGAWWASKAGPAADIVAAKQAADPCP